jgi:hypothetical protein
VRLDTPIGTVNGYLPGALNVSVTVVMANAESAAAQANALSPTAKQTARALMTHARRPAMARTGPFVAGVFERNGQSSSRTYAPILRIETMFSTYMSAVNHPRADACSPE